MLTQTGVRTSMTENPIQDTFSILGMQQSAGNPANKGLWQCPALKPNIFSESAKEAIHLKRFLSEILDQQKATVIYNDNQGTGWLYKNSVFHNHTKHVDIRHHFVRETIERGDIEVEYLPTEEMLINVLTKGWLLSTTSASCFSAWTGDPSKTETTIDLCMRCRLRGSVRANATRMPSLGEESNEGLSCAVLRIEMDNHFVRVVRYCAHKTSCIK